MRFILSHKLARERAIQAITDAPEGFVVEIKEPTRREAQSARFHAICSDIVKSGKKFAGETRSKDDWKYLLVSAHAFATNQGGQPMPGLEGEFVTLRESTARMGIKRMASLIEYCEAWCENEGIKLSASHD